MSSYPHAYPVPDSPALGPVPLDYLAPDGGRTAPEPAAPTRAQWFASLSDWLPPAFVAGRRVELESLRRDGVGPRLAATYCRAYLLAPATL